MPGRAPHSLQEKFVFISQCNPEPNREKNREAIATVIQLALALTLLAPPADVYPGRRDLQHKNKLTTSVSSVSQAKSTQFLKQRLVSGAKYSATLPEGLCFI